MSKAIYIPENGTLIKHNKMYEVVNGQNHKILKGYIVEPVHYTILEYIESTGTQYIDTGFKPNQNTKVEAEYAWISGNSAVCGVRESNTGFLLYHESNLVYTMYGTTYASTGVTASANKATAVMDGVARIVTIGENSVSLASATFQMNYPMYLFGYSESGTADSKGSIRLYSCKIYDNGTLIRDYVPCKDTTGAVGLYDKVAGKFYTNAGTGTFTAGAETDVRHTKSVTKLFYSAGPSVLYTGTHTLTQIEKDGMTYNLLTMTGSGVLTIECADDDTEGIRVWICGGGTGGYGGYTKKTGEYPIYSYRKKPGNGGSGGYTLDGTLPSGVYAVTIGAGGVGGKGYAVETSAPATCTPVAGSDTTITSADGTTITAPGGTTTDGGSGGGGAMIERDDGGQTYNAPFKGDGISKYPFSINSLYAHCAGGAGGSYAAPSNPYHGGNGGSNGSGGYGKVGYTLSDSMYLKGTGGDRGGGAGADNGNMTTNAAGAGGNATFYGSGGGGGGATSNDLGSSSIYGGAGGAGYQGVAYALWPKS